MEAVRIEAAQRIARYQQNMAGHYNQMVKLRRFSIRDLVLQKITPMTKNLMQGKLGPT